jgi:hypothetical protein
VTGVDISIFQTVIEDKTNRTQHGDYVSGGYGVKAIPRSKDLSEIPNNVFTMSRCFIAVRRN